MEKSLKISTKTLRRGLAPAMALLLALTLTVSAGMWANSAALDDYFGRGARTITVVEGSGGWDRTYYPRLYANARESRAAAAALSRTVSDEGIVLLKNDGLLPLSPSAEISPFGLRYVDPYYGGAGSSAIDPGADYVVTAQEGLHRAFGRINAALEEKLLQAYEPGTDPAGNPGITAAVPLDGGEGVIHEFDSALYQGTESACSGTVGVVFVGRRTGESADAHAGAYSDGTPHMLALTAAERAAVNLGQIAMTALVASLGTVALAANQIATTAEGLCYMPAYGISYAATALVGQSVGAQNREDAEGYGTLSGRLGFFLCLGTGARLFLLARPLATLFNSDPAVVDQAALVLRIVSVAEPFFALSIVFTGALRGGQDVRFPMAASLICMWGVRIVLAPILVFVFRMGLEAVWIAMSADLVLRGILCTVRWRSGKWRRMCGLETAAVK